MALLLKLVLVALALSTRAEVVTDAGEECVIELQCEECLPENMPAVTAPAAERGAVRVPHGAELALDCGRGHFLAFPRSSLVARCHAGRYRVGGRLHALLELGCQQDVLEDVQHAVAGCAPPLQGRAYLTQAGGRARHLAALCFDADRAAAAWARLGGDALPPHEERRGPLSLLGNFDQMFDASTRHAAERLFGDEARLERRLRALYRPERYAFAGQRLVAARLLAPAYFAPADARAAELVSNKLLAWRSVAEGNLRHLQADVAAYLARPGSGAAVAAGTHEVLALQAGERRELYLGAGRRFPVARYAWTAVAARGRGVALVLLNDPFVTVSEIRAAVFCASACGRVSWLAELTRHRNYERPLLGLVFCCELAEFAAHVPAAPRLNATGLLVD